MSMSREACGEHAEFGTDDVGWNVPRPYGEVQISGKAFCTYDEFVKRFRRFFDTDTNTETRTPPACARSLDNSSNCHVPCRNKEDHRSWGRDGHWAAVAPSGSERRPYRPPWPRSRNYYVPVNVYVRVFGKMDANIKYLKEQITEGDKCA